MKNLYFLVPFVLLTMLLCRGCPKNNRTIQDNKQGRTEITPLPVPVKTVKPTINVYIENSGSMDGYVNEKTEFKTTLYNYLSDIDLKHMADSSNLFYINSKVIKVNLPLEDFILNLTPKSFRDYGGDRGFSDISNVLGTILEKTDENQISILVTDGIFSPGQGKDAEQYLNNQQTSIKRRFAQYLEKNKNAAVIVYQLSSNFNGIYYNKVDAKITINEQRPYYIWVIGEAKQVSELRKQVPDSKFIGNGVQNIFTAVAGNHIVKYAVKPSSGKFNNSRTDAKTIENLKKDSRTGKAKFSVNANFSDLLLDDNYLLDTNNYENGSKYSLDIKPIATKSRDYSHTLTFSSERVYQGTVSVKLKSQLPAWIDEVNDVEGTTAVERKTYGIKYQIVGVFNAFTFNNNYYTEIKISIK